MDRGKENSRRGMVGQRPSERRFGGESGFSLVELLVAISIMAIGLLAAATTLSTGIGSNRMAQRLTVETNLAYSVLDEFLAKDAGDALFDADSTGVTYDLDTGSGAATRTVNGVTYSAVYSVDADNPVPGVAEITVTVSGGNRSVTLTTLKRSI